MFVLHAINSMNVAAQRCLGGKAWPVELIPRPARDQPMFLSQNAMGLARPRPPWTSYLVSSWKLRAQEEGQSETSSQHGQGQGERAPRHLQELRAQEDLQELRAQEEGQSKTMS